MPATTNSVRATLQVRHDTAQNWLTRNPILAEGEYGLEVNTFLIKIGDGVRTWENLPYLNKLDATYFKQTADGSLTFSDSFMNTVNAMQALAGNAISSLTITDQPVNDTDAANKAYVDQAIRNAGHLTREIVQELPAIADADENTMYLMASESGNGYEEYMLIGGAWDMVGNTSDSAGGGYELPIATTARLGGVKASVEADYINVTQEGFMTLNQVSTSKLYVPTGDTFIIYGGTA